jgi:hypothetical protein
VCEIANDYRELELLPRSKFENVAGGQLFVGLVRRFVLDNHARKKVPLRNLLAQRPLAFHLARTRPSWLNRRLDIDFRCQGKHKALPVQSYEILL